MKEVNKSKIYFEKDVLTSAQERIAFMFDEFPNIWCSVSGGKDSTVLFSLVYAEAEKRNRTINLFFLDQEAEYQSSITIVREMMHRPLVVPYWFQVSIRMTSAVSYEQDFLNAWDPSERDLWIRLQEEISIKENPGKADRFYDFISEYNNATPDSCWFVGLRAEESLNRFRTMKKAGYKGKNWTTFFNKLKRITNAYPLYDWTFEDVWKYIFEFQVSYNSVYDKQFMLEYNLPEMRVSNLIHEMSYKCLRDLPKIEPDTYNLLQHRLKGIATAQRYAKKIQIFNANEIPNDFKTYHEWRDNLLIELPLKPDKKKVFIKRFAANIERHGDFESVYKHQVRQLLMNDWENNLPLIKKEEVDLYAKWREIL